MGIRADEAFKAEALQEYVDQHMSPKEFSEYTGIPMAQVYRILAGEVWVTTPRPEGFEYPWPEHAHKCHKRYDAKRVEQYIESFQQAQAEKWPLKRIAKEHGISITTVYTIRKMLTDLGHLEPV